MTQFSNKRNKEYDLEERTAKFAEKIIEFVRAVKRDDVNRNIITQLVRAATSIGANYCEANASSSRRDFRNKIFICKKEANETKYWLRMLAKHHGELKPPPARRLGEASFGAALVRLNRTGGSSPSTQDSGGFRLAAGELKGKIRIFWREAHEFHLIFQKITNTLDKKV